MADVGWNFASAWEAIADEHPEWVAQIHGESVSDWGTFDRRADGLARLLLAAGLGHQAKVAQYLYNSPEYLESVFAAFKAGCVPVNTNYRYGDDEIAYLWDDADVEAVVYCHEFRSLCQRVRRRVPAVRLWVEVGPATDVPEWAVPYEEPAGSVGDRVTSPTGRSGADLFLLYTGGTTGMPKGVMWRQDQLYRYLETQSGRDGSLTADPQGRATALTRPGPRVLPAPPLMHGTGAWFAMSALDSGGSVVTSAQSRFDAATVLDEIARHGVQGVAIVGDPFGRPLVEALDRAGTAIDLGRWRLLVSSGAILSEPVKDRLLSHLPSLLIKDELGSSESGSMASSSKGRGGVGTGFRLKAGSKVIDDCGQEVAIGKGRLAVTGHLPDGYYKDPEKTAATFVEMEGNRYVYTGDWVDLEPDGTARLLGRGSACINTGGEKVFPEEVEEVLARHPAVRDVVVVGLPDERFGEAVTAVVEVTGAGPVPEEELTALCRQVLAAYKCPRRFIHVATVGRASNGKVDRRRITLEASRPMPSVHTREPSR